MKKGRPKGIPHVDRTGHRFGRLVAIKRSKKQTKNGGVFYWIYKCDCGTKVELPPSYVTSGDTKSCGCLKKEISSQTGKKNIKHGLSNSRIWNIHKGMLKRCFNKKHQAFHNYGGRGIFVCKRWLKFENFVSDMGYPPSSKHTLGRIDNNKEYSIKNCQWSTWKEQQNNRRNNKILTWRGKTLNASQWAIKLNIKRSIIYDRLRSGWSTEETLSGLNYRSDIDGRHRRVGKLGLTRFLTP